MILFLFELVMLIIVTSYAGVTGLLLWTIASILAKILAKMK